MAKAKQIDLAALGRDLKSKDANYVKVELEAVFGRRFYTLTGQRPDCNSCESSGTILCEYCSEGENDEGVECYECSGDWDRDCEDCPMPDESNMPETLDDEDKPNYNFRSETECERYIMDNLSTYAKRALVFKRFYNDGSVDSEFTFTVKSEHLKYIPEIMRVFWSIGEHTGKQETIGAGMHIAVMKGSGYITTRSKDDLFDPDKLQNFRSQVHKLLPALFFLGTANAKTRALGYRHPQISTNKYSAIHEVSVTFIEKREGEPADPNTHEFYVWSVENRSNTVSGICALEYRVFDVCYDKPEKIFEMFQVIARTLEYYKNPELKVNVGTCKFNFRDKDGDHLSRYFDTSENLSVLNRVLPYLLDEQTTVDDVKRERNFRLTQERIKQINDRKRQALIDKFNRMLERLPDDASFDSLDIVERQPQLGTSNINLTIEIN